MEVRFAELERDPLGTLRSIYSSLSLGGFDGMQPLFERYIGGLEMSGFRKNAHRWAGRQALWVRGCSGGRCKRRGGRGSSAAPGWQFLYSLPSVALTH